MMKKTYILLIVLLIPITMLGQLEGDGSYGDPYQGTLEEGGDVTWSTDTYIDGDIIVDDEKLTISAGVNIIFIANDADLIITGTGQLTADGTSGSKITFTADDDDNGTYGEDGERWGHIYFNNPSGASLLDYCIIEWGDVSGKSGAASYGGGIHIDFSNLTISNSIIRDNKAKYGGGIFINKSENPAINNCHLYDNTANIGGGGIYLWNDVYSIIENCIIEKNICSSFSYGGGGLYIGPLTGTAKIVNCTIVNNTAPNGDGSNVFFHTTESLKLINSVIWDDNNSVYFNGSYSSNNFINCAVERAYNSSGTIAITKFTNCIDLNSSNSASDGPNFNNPTSDDYSITVASPCLDAGTDTDAPSTDYDGNNRISPYDIGAYEVLYYSRWTGASSNVWDLAGNWDIDGKPTSSNDVVIPSGKSNYPTSSSTQDFTIGSGKYMIVGPGAQVTLGTLTNNGTLTLKTDATDIASLIVDAYTNNGETGTENIELYLTGGGGLDYKWHYISSPVTALPVITFAPTPTINFVQYIEDRPTDDLLQGWIGYDGYIYDGGGFDISYKIDADDLIVGQGYNYYDTEAYKFSFAGTLNTENVDKAIPFEGDDTYNGFNLLGNPFSSGLNWDVIIDDVFYPANTSKGLYFTSDNAQCTYINDVGIPGHVTGIIPPMQGFFTKTYDIDNVIPLLASARTHNSIHARYKGKSEIPLVRLSLTKDSISDETVVRFDEKADPGLDYDFDALKMFLSDNKLSIYSYTGETKYAINGQPFPENSLDIPLVINSPQADSLKITATQIQGLEDYDLILKDLDQDFSIDLNEVNEYIFNADSGTVTDRFILTISSTTGIEDIHDSPGFFNVFSANNQINIKTLSDAWNGKTGTVKIFDITGRTLSEIHNKEFWKNSILQVPASPAKGIYFIEIRAGGLRYVGRVGVVK